MLKLFVGCIKFLFLSLFILVLGNYLHWGDKTISDQIKVGMSHADESRLIDSIRDWAKKVTKDVKGGIENKLEAVNSEEEITSTERQKLKALIRELNSTRKN